MYRHIYMPIWLYYHRILTGYRNSGHSKTPFLVWGDVTLYYENYWVTFN